MKSVESVVFRKRKEFPGQITDAAMNVLIELKASLDEKLNKNARGMEVARLEFKGHGWSGSEWRLGCRNRAGGWTTDFRYDTDGSTKG